MSSKVRLLVRAECSKSCRPTFSYKFASTILASRVQLCNIHCGTRPDEIWLSEEETKMDTLCVSKVVSNKLTLLSQKWMLVGVNEQDGVGGVNCCMVPE